MTPEAERRACVREVARLNRQIEAYQRRMAQDEQRDREKFKPGRRVRPLRKAAPVTQQTPVFLRPRFREIIDAVAVEFGVSREQIVGPSRKAAIAAVRHTAMLRCHLAGASYPLIGSMFARDHTSVIQAVRKVSGDPRYAAKQAKLRAWYAAKKAMSNGAA